MIASIDNADPLAAGAKRSDLPVRAYRFFQRHLVALVAVTLLASGVVGNSAMAKTEQAVNQDASEALEALFQSIPEARKIAKDAKGTLIFPSIYKAGLLIGGSFGEGVLRVPGRQNEYYTTTSLSYGLQIGGTRYGYIMFFMDKDSLNYVERTEGWEVGVGPTLVAGDAQFAKKFSTTTMEKGVIVFFIDQRGVFAGVGLEGTKITRGLATNN